MVGALFMPECPVTPVGFNTLQHSCAACDYFTTMYS